MEYMRVKNKMNEKLFSFYEGEIFRKYRWYGYINRQRADAKMVNKIKEKYRKVGVFRGSHRVTDDSVR